MSLVQTVFFWLGVGFSVATATAVIVLIINFLIWRGVENIRREMAELVGNKELLRIVKELAGKAKAKHAEDLAKEHADAPTEL